MEYCLEIKDEKVEVTNSIKSPDHESKSQSIYLDKCDFESICRICLSETNSNLIPLNSLINSEKILEDIFTAVTSIQMSADDNLPSQICFLCRNQLEQCYDFKQLCVNSHNTLKSILRNVVSSKELTLDNRSNKNSEECNVKIEIKEETLSEDVEYLEEFSDLEGDDLLVPAFKTSRTKRTDKNDIKASTDLQHDANTNNIKKDGSTKDLKKKPNNFKCGFCAKVYTKIKSLHGHLQRKHYKTTPAFSCRECQEHFSTGQDLELHLTLHQDTSLWICIRCKKEFKDKRILRRHILRHMESKAFSCDSCDKTFTELYALRRHRRVHTGEAVEKRFKCTHCDKRFLDNAQRRAHESHHTGARPFACAACGKCFPTERLLASHTLVHTDNKPYACTLCDKRFRHESTLRTHHRTHTGEKPYVCAQCGKTFIQNSNLTLHLRTHTGERPYKCDKCDRRFSSGSSLKNHMRTHTGEKPFSCPICGKRFCRGAMRAHLLRHSGERPHVCNFCPKKFATASRLREHNKTHTGEKPFECAICTQQFHTKPRLVKHLKVHAKKEKLASVKSKTSQRSNKSLQKLCIENADDDLAGNEVVVCADSLIKQEIPLEVGEELVLQDDSDSKTDYLVVDNSTNSEICQSNNLSMNSGGVNIINNTNNSLVTVNEGEVSISASNCVERTTVKLYQLDQSLLEIHAVAGQVTISKITSKMTANF